MKHRISLDFGKPNLGIDQAIRDLQEYQYWLDRKTEELCMAIAEVGRQVAETNFSSSKNNDGNNTDVQVFAEKQGDMWKVRAYGEDIAFIEFGAGTQVKPQVLTDSSGGQIANYPGVYSEDNTKEFATYGSWHHKKVKYFSIIPGNCMQNTSRYLLSRLPDIIKGVFEHD